MKKKSWLTGLLLLSLCFPSAVGASEETKSSSSVDIVEQTSSESIIQESTSTTESVVESMTQESSDTTTDSTVESSTSLEEEPTKEQEVTVTREIESFYVSVTSEHDDIFDKVGGVVIGKTSQLVNHTFLVSEAVEENGETYYALYNGKNKLEGYVLSTAVKKADGAQGIYMSFGKYVTIKNSTDKVYQNFDWKVRTTTDKIKNKTYLAKGYYQHIDGQVYYSLYDDKGSWQGYVNAKSTEIAPGKEGFPIKMDEYVTITKKNYQVWENFKWVEKNNSSNILNNLYQVRERFEHMNGSTYYSLYDNKGKWMGYINANGVTKASGAQGPWIKENKYVTVSSNNYDMWQNFNWVKKQSSSKLYNKTYKVTGKYKHFNGSTYYSLYDNKGSWQGYVNANATKTGNGAQGAFISDNRYATITKKNYDMWQNFSWKQKSKTNGIYHETLQIRGYYNHFNGSKYYSLYNNKGTWKGYLNSSAAQIGDGKQGIWLSSNDAVTISKRNYDMWQNFSWKKKNNTNQFINQRVRAKGYYNHFNGDRYYSIYNNNGTWLGYLNSSAVSFKRTVGDFLGTDRNRLVSRLKSHENDRFYLGTPYRSLNGNPYNRGYVMSPNGAPTGFGPGMNCTGFVAYAYQDGGANLNKITSASNQWGGIGNAYNWRNALTANTDYQVFNSINQLLSSGQAKRGDILYFEPNYNLPGPDPHIGIFWGANGKDNKIWHSTYPVNNISHIYSGTPFTKIYLFSLD